MAARIVELQEQIERLTQDLSRSQQVNEITNRNNELETQISELQKEMRHTMEQSNKLENQIQELEAERNEQEAKISSLESRHLNDERKISMYKDMKDKLEEAVIIEFLELGYPLNVKIFEKIFFS
uniref:Liprin-alpha CC2 domain-containing protein n=1 Tax=Acrobeloides nanus TaxID=290746 RepID=A0A914CXZ6_9BILA